MVRGHSNSLSKITANTVNTKKKFSLTEWHGLKTNQTSRLLKNNLVCLKFNKMTTNIKI